MGKNQRKYIGEILRDDIGAIDSGQIKGILKEQQRSKHRFGAIAVGAGLINEDDLIRALAIQFDMEYVVNLSSTKVKKEMLELIPEATALEHRVMPVEKRNTGDGEELILAISDPLDLYTLDNVRFMTNTPVCAVLASEDEILDCINYNYRGIRSAESVDREQQRKEKRERDIYDKNLFSRSELQTIRERSLALADCSQTSPLRRGAYKKIAHGCDYLDALIAREESYKEVEAEEKEKPNKKRKKKAKKKRQARKGGKKIARRK